MSMENAQVWALDASRVSSKAPQFPQTDVHMPRLQLTTHHARAHVKTGAFDANTAHQNMSSSPGTARTTRTTRTTRMAHDGRSIDAARAS